MNLRSTRGSSFIYVLILMLFVAPVVLVFLQSAINQNKTAARETQIKQARTLSGNVLVDFMRQFSQNQSESYMDESLVGRAQSLYGMGYTDVTTEIDQTGHSLYISAEGKSGATRHLDAVVRFSADATRFGNMFNSNTTLTASNSTYSGGFYVNGNLTLTGTGVIYNGGPVVVKGAINVPGSTVFNTDIYVDGTTTLNGATVNGAIYNYTPDVVMPTINTAYYSLHNNHMVNNVNQTWVFSVQTSTQGIFSVQGTTVVVRIPATGAVLFAQNSNITIRGTLRGRVTMVVTGTAGAGTGNLTVAGPFVYANGLNAASAEDSFAALVSNTIEIQCNTVPPQEAPSNTRFTTVNGLFSSVTGGQVNLRNLTGGGFASMRFYGTRTNPFTLTSGGGTWTPVQFFFDANLTRYPPPGLPEKPRLVTWRMSS